MAPQLDGRVFSRLQQFAALHEEFQEEVKALEVYLTAHQADVFGLHHANLVKTVRSIRAKPLIETIDTWLQNKNAPVVVPADETSLPSTEEEAAHIEAATTPATTTEETAPIPVPATEQAPTATELAPTATEEAPAATEHAPAAAVEAAPAVVPTTEDAAVTRRAHAAKLLEGLVLHGFLTPYKEHEKMPTTPTIDTTPAPLHFKDSELFVPLAPEVNDAKTLNVWHLVDGAVFAGVLKRKAGFLAPLTQGKDVYAVVNQRLNSLTLFETDVGREPIVHFEASVTPAVDGAEPSVAKVHVSFDKSHFVHGIKIWNDVTTELLNAATKLEREVIIHALIGAGLQYREDLTINPENIKSIYELKDASIDGDEIVFDKYKGKVLLIVNVSSACGLTPTNYPELVTLDTKYRDQGLEILAFPCNQFWGQEPGTHEEIKAFVAQYNVAFQLFEKGDVNGTETRPVFAYLKAKQPGIGGDYIKWNFTKFLVDRNGQPVQRYAPTETPLSFEDEIVKLLSAKAELDTVSLTSETAEATTEKEAEAMALPATEETPAPVVVAAPAPAPVEDVPAPAPAPVETVPAPATAPVETVPEPAPVENVPAPAPVEEVAPVAVSPPSLEFVETKEPETTTTTTTTTTDVVTADKIVDALTKSEATSEPVTTLSMDNQPLPVVEQELPAVPETAPVVVEQEPAPETKVEVETKSAVADAAGEEMAVPATSSSSVPVTKTQAGQVVQGFTPGNEPAALAAPAP